MSDTPELGRLVVLHGAILAYLFDVIDVEREDVELKPILKEIDALTMRIAHRSRSAIGYDKTLRGRAALEDIAQIVVARAAAEEEDPMWVELEHQVWSVEQLQGQITPDMKPERTIVTRQFIGGLRTLSPDFDGPPPPPNE